MRYAFCMIIILTGASTIGRTTIAETLCKKHSDWKHVPADQIAALAGHHGLRVDENPALMITLSYECAKELKQSGFSTIITYGESDELLKEARKDFSNETCLISLSTDSDPDLFDIILDGSKGSLVDAVSAIEEFIDTPRP